MHLDLIEKRTDDMSERWWGMFRTEDKPNPASSIPFPWFFSKYGSQYQIGVHLEADSEESARNLIELYLGIDLDGIRWSYNLCDDDYSIQQVMDWYFTGYEFDKRLLAKFGISPPPEPKKKAKKKKAKKKTRRSGW
jgi:hypothetical protein